MRFNPVQILLSLPAVFLAMSFHEFAHAYTAYKMGDPTPKYQGRLTLDPLAHVDWIGVIMFAIFGFGWAKPVEVNPVNFKNRKWGDILVSLSGPAANLILAFTVFLIFIFTRPYLSHIPFLTDIINYIVTLNIVFSILNLIPIPPFDGYHVIKDLFFRKYASFFWQYEKYSIFVLVGCILLGVFDLVVGAPAGYIYSLFWKIGMSLVGFF